MIVLQKTKFLERISHGIMFNNVLLNLKAWFREIMPIRKSELRLFLPISILMFLILFNTTIFKTIKDTLIIAEQSSGIEVVNFLKVFIVVPMSFVFVMLYSKACNKFENQSIFYIIISLFTLFFLIFSFILYPNKDYLHPAAEYMSQLKAHYPRFRWMLPVYGLWTYSLFYAIADLWCSMCLSLLFWQFANQIIPKADSKRFYASFAVIGYLGLIIGGHIIKTIFNPDSANFGYNLKFILLITCVSNMMIMLLYKFINSSVINKNICFTPKKSSMPMIESFKLVFTNRRLTYIMLIVFCYNFSINIVETTWKGQLKKFATNKANFVYYMGTINQIVGYSTIFLGFIANILFKRFSWWVTAMVTPIFALITSSVFFGFVSMHYIKMTSLFGVSILFLSVIFGTIHNVLSKSGKYVFFDQTKEMAYLSLSEDMKTKGKAAIDVAGSRLSKSLSGQTQALLLVLIPNSTQLTIFPYLAAVLCAIFIIWFWALHLLQKQVSTEFTEQTQ